MKCSKCGKEFIADYVLMDANNNKYCPDCAIELTKPSKPSNENFNMFIKKIQNEKETI